MDEILNIVRMFWAEEDGQDLVEYSLLLAFIALGAVAILNGAHASIRSLWFSISNALTSATTAAS